MADNAFWNHHCSPHKNDGTAHRTNEGMHTNTRKNHTPNISVPTKLLTNTTLRHVIQSVASTTMMNPTANECAQVIFASFPFFTVVDSKSAFVHIYKNKKKKIYSSKHLKRGISVLQLPLFSSALRNLHLFK